MPAPQYHLEYQDTSMRSQPAEGVLVCNDMRAAMSAAFNLWRATNMHVRVTAWSPGLTSTIVEYHPEQPAEF